jgi:DNA polymerase-1
VCRCGPIHDAILIEAPIDEIDTAVDIARAAMEAASGEVLEDHIVSVDAEIVRWPDRYQPEDGRDMFDRVMGLAGSVESVLV